MRALALYILIFAGLWMLAWTVSKQDELTKAARECSKPFTALVSVDQPQQSFIQ